MSDHSWVHIQIVTNIALRLARLLFRRGVVPSSSTDHGMTERDAEVVIAAGALFHCVGMSIHRADHERLHAVPDRRQARHAAGGASTTSRERSIVVAEALHAIIGHRTQAASRSRSRARSCASPTRSTWPRAARACRSRRGHQNIHSLSAYAIEEVKISPGDGQGRARRDRDVQQRRASSRSTRAWAPSCAARRWSEHIEVDRAHRRRARETPPAGLSHLRRRLPGVGARRCWYAGARPCSLARPSTCGAVGAAPCWW